MEGKGFYDLTGYHLVDSDFQNSIFLRVCRRGSTKDNGATAKTFELHHRVVDLHNSFHRVDILTVFQFYSAGELTTEELERIVTILQTPTQYKIPTWFLNRQRDITDGKDSQVVSNGLDSKLREDLERLKKIRSHRGLRHYWGLRVRGQHTKTTGRRGRTVGVSKKKG